jgi:hypothetical protein
VKVFFLTLEAEARRKVIPSKADLELLGIQEKGKEWEI